METWKKMDESERIGSNIFSGEEKFKVILQLWNKFISTKLINFNTESWNSSEELVEYYFLG